MKPSKMPFILLLGLLLVFSCETPSRPDESKGEISESEESRDAFLHGISFNATFGTSVVSFTATNVWRADVMDTKASTWLSVSPSSGGAGLVTMTVLAQPNNEEAEREALVTLVCGEASKSFRAKQAGAPSVTVEVSSVTLNKTSTILTVGESETLIATVFPDNATDKTVTWTTSNGSVAIVDNGVVKALAGGTAAIMAKAGNYSATCNVTVIDSTSGDNEGTGTEDWN